MGNPCLLLNFAVNLKKIVLKKKKKKCHRRSRIFRLSDPCRVRAYFLCLPGLTGSFQMLVSWDLVNKPMFIFPINFTICNV